MNQPARPGTPHVTRRDLLRGGTAAGGAVLLGGSLGPLLAACASSSTSPSPAVLTASQIAGARGTIHVLGWQFYESDKTQNTSRVKASWSYITSSDQIATKIKPAHSFDVFTSSASLMDEFYAVKRIAPLDISLLPNYHLIVPAVRESSVWKGPDGKVYAVPLAGSAGLTAWDSAHVPEPRTMQDLLKPVYRGILGVLDDPNTLWQFARGLGLSPASHPERLTHQQLDQVMAYLGKLKPQIKTLYGFGEEVNLFSRGDIRVAFQSFGSLVTSASKNGAKVKGNYLGSVMFVDALSVTPDANMAASYQWINQAISVAGQQGMAQASLANPVVDAANNALPPSLRISFAKLAVLSPILGPFPVTSSGDQVSGQDLATAWSNFKGSFA